VPNLRIAKVFGQGIVGSKTFHKLEIYFQILDLVPKGSENHFRLPLIDSILSKIENTIALYILYYTFALISLVETFSPFFSSAIIYLARE